MKIAILLLSLLISNIAFADKIDDIRIKAQNGDVTSQFYMGLLYDNGQEVNKDQKEAAKWYNLAAEQGSAGAQNNLALLYANGWGVERDYLLAHMWANYAIGNGVSEATELLVSLEGDMTDEQIEKAKDMLRERIATRSLFKS